MPRSAATLERYLHDHIPITRPLGVRVLEATSDAVHLSAPLAPNVNHRKTAFGGSLSALAILAAWSWLHLRLRADGFVGRIVIQGNSMEYVAPADGGFDALCPAPSPERWTQFARTLERRGRARLKLEVEVRVSDQLVARFRGEYVAVRGTTDD